MVVTPTTSTPTMRTRCGCCDLLIRPDVAAASAAAISPDGAHDRDRVAGRLGFVRGRGHRPGLAPGAADTRGGGQRRLRAGRQDGDDRRRRRQGDRLGSRRRPETGGVAGSGRARPGRAGEPGWIDALHRRHRRRDAGVGPDRRRGASGAVRASSASLQCCDSVTPQAPAFALSPDGTGFAVPTGDSKVGVYSTATLRREKSFAIGSASQPMTALSWSPGGKTLAVGAHGGIVQLWDVGRARRSGSARLWDLEPLPGQIEAIQSLAFSPEGSSSPRATRARAPLSDTTSSRPVATLATWEVGSGTMITPPAELGAGAGMNGSDVLAFSPDGRLLAASLLTGGVRVFDPATARVLRTLTDPGNDTVSLAFAPKGDVARPAPWPGPSSCGIRSQPSASRNRCWRTPRRSQHRVRSQRPAVRDHRAAGRDGEDLVHEQSRAGRSPPRRRSRRYRRDGIRTGRAGPARRRRSRRRLHLADVTDELGAARLLARRSKPHAGRVGAVRCRAGRTRRSAAEPSAPPPGLGDPGQRAGSSSSARSSSGGTP